MSSQKSKAKINKPKRKIPRTHVHRERERASERDKSDAWKSCMRHANEMTLNEMCVRVKCEEYKKSRN